MGFWNDFTPFVDGWGERLAVCDGPGPRLKPKTLLRGACRKHLASVPTASF
jgi:hypothetical protein